MPPLHSPSATPAAPDRNAKLNALHPRFRNLGLELRNALALFQPASASRTAGRQRYFDNFINAVGKGPAIAATILLSRFASECLRLALGFCREKGAACRFAARNASSNNCRSRSISFFNTSFSCSSRASLESWKTQRSKCSKHPFGCLALFRPLLAALLSIYTWPYVPLPVSQTFVKKPL
jgi:hypothetical protein